MATVATVPASAIAEDARLSLAPEDYIVNHRGYDRREAAARRALNKAATALSRVAAERAAAVERSIARGVVQEGCETTRRRFKNTERGWQ